MRAEMSNPRRKLWRRILYWSALLVFAFVFLRAYVQPYTLAGSSDAPTLLLGDRVWVNRTAYDVRLPYSDRVLWSRAGPAHGDLALVASPDDGRLIFKRVVALPGDRVAMRDHHLIVNGRQLVYTATDSAAFASVPADNRLGSVFETEALGTHAHLITYTPGSETSSFPEVLVPADHYFLMGDNRDSSRDSRIWGSVPRERLRGRVFWQPRGE
jgi:signal peptidase I